MSVILTSEKWHHSAKLFFISTPNTPNIERYPHVPEVEKPQLSEKQTSHSRNDALFLRITGNEFLEINFFSLNLPEFA